MNSIYGKRRTNNGRSSARAVNLLRLLLGYASLVLMVPLPAHSAQETGGAAPAQMSADEEWKELRDIGRPTAPQSGNAPEAAERTRQRIASDMVRDADRLKTFYTRNANHEAAEQAKRLEALALVFAWQAGDDRSLDRCRSAVADVRKNTKVPAAERSEVAAFFENVGVEKRNGLSPAERLAAYEETARKLATEFPDLPDAYEALVHIASDSSDDRAAMLAAELAKMDRAPAWVKREARMISARYELIGRSAAEQTNLIFAADNPFAKAAGKPLVIYTWATFHPPSITGAKELLAQVPASVALIGICLDQRDLKPARALAQNESLPGEQIFDWLGRRGEVAEALAAVEPGLVYVADSKGVIRSVSAQRNLHAALAGAQ